jgi:hypothetical protein
MCEMLRRLAILCSLISANQFCDDAVTMAGLIQVDFSTLDASAQNTGYSPNRVQDGFSDFSYGPENAQPSKDQAVLQPPFPGASPTITKTFGSIGVTVSDPGPASNGLIFVDEGTVNGSYGKLAEDYVIPSALNLRVSLSGLAAGSYLMTTYHHIPSLSNQYNLTGITIDTGTGASTVATNVPVSIGYSPTSIGSAAFQFTADGSHDVVMTVKGNSFSTVRGVLNGFEVSSVPEPSTALLAGLGVLGLVGRRIWRRSTWR